MWIGQLQELNMNSISNKFDQLKLFVYGKVDILIVTETKWDSPFPLLSLW